MNGLGQTASSLRFIACQHRELLQRALKLNQLLQMPVAEEQLNDAFADLRTQLGQLFELMQSHFAQEAAGGYLEEAVARVPRLASEADALESEHEGLLAELKAQVQAANDADLSLPAWQQLGIRFGRLAARVLAHETAENRLLQQGFNADPSLFD